MSAELPLNIPAANPHDRARDDVNCWRGHCVENFARIERALADVLAVMSKATDGAVKVPTTFGGRVSALAASVAPDGAFPNPAMARAIEDGQQVLKQRNRVIHATGKISLDRNDAWIWTYRFRPSGKDDETGFYEREGANAFEKDLQKLTQSLCAKLGNLTRKVQNVSA